MSHASSLTSLLEALGRLSPGDRRYAIPRLWRAESDGSAVPLPRETSAGAAGWYASRIASILAHDGRPPAPEQGRSWTLDAVIYNMFVRTTCAFDHDGNGRLDLPLNAAGWRETGTFLKAIAMLPAIRSLGANTIHLLPITAIGSDGNKGTLGSPYAIRNPYHLDGNLSEPILGLGVEEEFRAFVEAAHRLGLRVVVEFVFRTSSKDGDWVKEHPEWFYWIKAATPDRPPGSTDEHAYGNPLFTAEELARIHAAAASRRLLPPPHEAYRGLFTAPPASVAMEGGKYIGTTAGGEKARIPGAFADWPPDDAQPPWGDVTYLRMYDHPDFNYIAYNTIRMYDERLARRDHAVGPLWETIAGIIPHYQHSFGIDGVMIDMGHALPVELKQEMVARARAIDPHFAFWDENFSVNEASVREGYDAVIGYQWSDQHHPAKFRKLLERFGGEGYALPFFATAESHNTPRAAARPGGIRYSKYAWATSNFIPAIPFLHSGFEIGERMPINTGLDFTKDDLGRYPSAGLPLFSEYAYDWEKGEDLAPWIRKVAGLRRRFAALVTDRAPSSFCWLGDAAAPVAAFIRKGKGGSILVAANSDMRHEARYRVALHTAKTKLHSLLEGGDASFRDGHCEGQLGPGEVALFEL